MDSRLRLVQRVIAHQNEAATQLLDSIFSAWPDPQKTPLSLHERFLIEMQLGRFDSSLVRYANPARIMNDYYHPLMDSAFTEQMQILYRRAIMVTDFRNDASLPVEDSTFIEYLRKRYFHENLYGPDGYRDRGKSNSAEAYGFLNQFPQTRFRLYLEPFTKEVCHESRFRPGLGVNVSSFWLPNVPFSTSSRIVTQSYFDQDGERFSYAFGASIATFKVKEALVFQGTSFPAHSFFRNDLFMLEGRYRFPTSRIKSHQICLSGGLGTTSFHARNRMDKDSFSRQTSSFSVSIGYRFETGFGWVGDYGQPKKAGKGSLLNIKIYGLVRTGYLYVDPETPGFFISVGGGLQFNWAWPTHRPTKASLRRNRFKELPEGPQLEKWFLRLDKRTSNRRGPVF